MRLPTLHSSSLSIKIPAKLLAAGLLALCLAAAPSSAAEPPVNTPDYPGYLDFKELGLNTANEEVKIEVNLQDAVLAFVTEAMRPSDPELADALAKIRSIHFQMVHIPAAQRADASQRARALADRLEDRGWQRIVRIQQDGVLSYLHLLMQGNQIYGLTVMFLQKEDDNFGLINLAGEIDPAQLGRIGQRFEIDVLEQAQRQLGTERATPSTDEDQTAAKPGESP